MWDILAVVILVFIFLLRFFPTEFLARIFLAYGRFIDRWGL